MVLEIPQEDSSSSWVKGNQGVGYKVDVWVSDKGKESSNFKEISNLVFTLE